jgi:hypothetical protein
MLDSRSPLRSLDVLRPDGDQHDAQRFIIQLGSRIGIPAGGSNYSGGHMAGNVRRITGFGSIEVWASQHGEVSIKQEDPAVEDSYVSFPSALAKILCEMIEDAALEADQLGTPQGAETAGR